MPPSEFAELMQTVTERGLMRRRPLYETIKITATVSLLALSIALLFLIDNFWLQLLNAAFMAFCFVQVGFIGHDIAHNQITRNKATYRILGMGLGNLAIGLGLSWWANKHNAHHSNPNVEDEDPDIEIAIIAFSEKQAQEKRGISRAIVRYQAFLFFPILLLTSVSFRRSCTKFYLQNRKLYPWYEPIFYAMHFVIFFGLVFFALGLLEGIAFIAIQQALFGLYMGSVFAPNHKGMPVIKKGEKLDFLHLQVLTARNVRSSPLHDYWYGGLNYQIEHHLFPSMPRCNLKRAKAIVKKFCEQKKISYHETGFFQSYKEILVSLHSVSAPLRS